LSEEQLLTRYRQCVERGHVWRPLDASVIPIREAEWCGWCLRVRMAGFEGWSEWNGPHGANPVKALSSPQSLRRELISVSWQLHPPDCTVETHLYWSFMWLDRQPPCCQQ
jgi:hypothetical protein